MPKTLKFTGDDKNMTLEEIEAFVRAARAADAPGNSNVTATLCTTGKIKEIEVELPTS